MMISRLNRRSFLALTLTASAFVLAPLPVRAQADAKANRFEKEIQAFEAADKTSPPPKDGTVFIGASNIKRWATLTSDLKSLKAVNRGFGGSQIADSVEFADRIVIPYQPKVVFLNAGGNDLHSGKTPEQVFADYKTFVAKVRAALPETKINFLSIPPSPSRWAEVDKARAANRLIEDFARADAKLGFINTFAHMIGDDGQPRPELYVADQLHASPVCYALWTTLIKWDGALRDFARSTEASRPPKGAVLFIGSSSIVKWKSLAEDFPGHQVINRGFGGSFLSDSANLVHHLVLPLQPKQIVVYAGGNDLNAGKTPEQVFAAFQTFVEKVHAKQPETPIAFISIAPNPARWAQVEKVKQANQLIADYIQSRAKLTFINVFPHMLGEDGLPKPDLFVADRLHMNEKGYALWTPLVKAALK